MPYSINPAVFGSMFAVPTAVADNYIKLASASQLKTMLWVFRHTSEPIDSAAIAKAIGYSVSEVEDALVAMCEWGALVSDGKVITPLPVPEAPESEYRELPEMITVKPSYEQVIARCQESPEIAHMFKDIQQILGKTIGYDSECIFIMMHDQYGLPVEVIYMLVDYCVSVGKGNMSYIAKVGKSWGEKEIDSIEKADEQIKILNQCSAVWTEFAKMAGIHNPRPSSSQSAYLRTWTIELKFNVDMIYLAYEEMLDHSSRMSFPYMNKILLNWHAKGLKTPEDVEKDKDEYRKRGDTKHSAKTSANPNTKTSFNMDEFNRRADELPVYRKGE